MASTLDNRLFHTAPLDSLSNGDMTPTDAVAFEHSLSQNRWNTNRSIWNDAPKVFKYISSETKHADGGSTMSMKCGVTISDRCLVFPPRNNSVAVPEVSKPVTRASTTESHNNNAVKSAGPFSVPSSAMSSGQHTSTLISPTRLRSNATLSSDSSSGIASLGRPSLLPGSAPDIEPLNSSPSRSTFRERPESTIGSRFRPFQVEDTDEFVPSYLQSSDLNSHRGRIAYMNSLSHFQNDLVSTRTDDPITARGLSKTQQRFQSGNRAIHSMIPDAITRSEMAVHHPTNRPAYYAAVDRTSDMGRSSEASAYQTRTSPQHQPKFDNQEVSVRRKTSSLRPEVASYQPIGFNNGFQPSLIWQSNTVHNNRTTPPSFTLPHNCYPSQANQNAANQSVGVAEKDLSPGATNFYADQNGIRQQPPHRYGSKLSMVDHAQQGISAETQYHSAGRTEPLLSHSMNSNPNGRSSFIQSPAQPPYNSGHYQYMPDVSRLMLYEQPYSLDQVTDTSGFVTDAQFPQDSESRETRSELLEEFRACHKSKKYELRDIYGHIVEFSGDQNGSRFIQSKLEQANSDEKEQIFSELQTNARQLMTDCFGNYVIQKMFEYGNQSQKKILASHMQGYVLRLSLHAYGCRCVQKAFEHILTDQQATLIKELEGQVLCVVESQHGNHVIQKAVECMPAEHIQFIVDAHRNQVVRLSRNIYGCRIIQRMLEHCTPGAKRMILEELYSAIPALIDDQYGNYVIQCIISKCSPADKYTAIEFVQQKLFFYSTHKFASNVVEKAIQYAEEKQRTEIIRKLTTAHPDFGMQSPVMTLLKDQFGNYVIQTVLKNTAGPARKALADEVRHHLNFMGKAGRSKQVIAMADMLAVITAGHSPSSISTDPHTPRTPISLHRDGSMETSMGKTVDLVAAGYEIREQ